VASFPVDAVTNTPRSTKAKQGCMRAARTKSLDAYGTYVNSATNNARDVCTVPDAIEAATVPIVLVHVQMKGIKAARDTQCRFVLLLWRLLLLLALVLIVIVVAAGVITLVIDKLVVTPANACVNNEHHDSCDRNENGRRVSE
jgi:hypothetical protein